jgi:hypothetical protein
MSRTRDNLLTFEVLIWIREHGATPVHDGDVIVNSTQ